MNTEEFIAAAKAGTVTVIFEKINDGGTRIMECTLDSQQIPKMTYEINQQAANDHLVVYALDRNAWRSFRVSTVTEWYEGKPKCPHCSGDKTQPHKNCILR